MADAKGILVAGEVSQNNLDPTTLEMLAAARQLSKELGGEEVAIALMGAGLAPLAQKAISYGADKVYAVESPLLKELQPDARVAALEKVCREHSPRFVIGARSVHGRDPLVRLAFRLGAAVAQDCVKLSVEQGAGALVANRPVYGGNAMATVVCRSTPAVAVVRGKVYEPLSPDASRQGQVVNVSAAVSDSAIKARVVDQVEEQASGIRLEDARIVVGAGRGIGGPENLGPIEELAKILGAAVGASRAVCDAGWLPSSQQVGLTGKSIAPELYITVGISGASQHMAGCSGAKTIVAINKDKECNIFKEARYGVVGDWRKVLPAFIEQVRELVK